MTCRICGSASAEEPLLAWTEMTWLVVAAKANHTLYKLPCCDQCLQRGQQLGRFRLLYLVGFMLLSVLAGVCSALLFIPIDEGVFGWSLAVVVWIGITVAMYVLLSLLINSRTEEFLQPELDQKFKKRSGHVKKWTLFNSFSLTTRAPAKARIHPLGEYGELLTRPRVGDSEIAEEDRALSMDDLQKKYGYSKGTSVFEAIHATMT